MPAVQGAIRPRSDVQAMFGHIVPRYDLVNRVMTGRRDVAWRKMAAREALRTMTPNTAVVLDVATGTGDLALALTEAGAARVIGIDFSPQMLREAARKAAYIPESRVQWVEGDAMGLPFPSDAFDAVTVGFGLRNLPSYANGLSEMVRVLRPGGTLVCLETSRPANKSLKFAFDWYFSRIVPVIGSLLAGDRDAYAYLPASAAAFPDAETLGQLMLRVGLISVRYRKLGLGTVALHVATKRSDASALTAVHDDVPAPRQREPLDEPNQGE